MLSDRGNSVLYRPLVLTPRQGALLGMLWIAVEKSRERGEGPDVDSQLLGELVFTAQNRGMVSRAVYFDFDNGVLPYFEAPVLRLALEALREAGLIHASEDGRTIGFPTGFLGMSMYDLPTGIFRHFRVFGFAELVDEFTVGGDK